MSGKRKANFALGFSWGHENDRYKRIRKDLLPCFVLFCVMEQACKWVSNHHPTGQACRDYNWLSMNPRPSSFSLFVLCSWFVRGSISRRTALPPMGQHHRRNLLKNERLEKLVSVRLTSEELPVIWLLEMVDVFVRRKIRGKCILAFQIWKAFLISCNALFWA